MASNVFGGPVTNSTLKALGQYGGKKNPTRVDRARVALEMMNAEEKPHNARQFAENLRKRYNNDQKEAGAMCLVYNATGNPITLMSYWEWVGHPLGSPFPMAIANGQWAAFYNQETNDKFVQRGSKTALVYQGVVDSNCSELDWIVSWSCSPNCSTNSVYTMAGEIPKDYPFNASAWGQIRSQLEARPRTTHESKNRGCMAMATIGAAPTTTFEVILTLDGLM